MRPACFDVGRNLAYAVWDGEREHFGKVPLLHLAHRHGLPEDNYGLGETMARWLGWFLDEYRPTALACEHTFATPDNPHAELAVLMRGYLGMVALRRGLTFREVPQQTLKKRTTGQGRFDSRTEGKRAMLRYVNLARPARAITDHDIADAVALLDMVREDADPRRHFLLRP